MASFKDHFSGHAADYASARPDYPDSLFGFLSDECQRRELAWDCATGNGQAAKSLARYFDKVIATDASAEQIANAGHEGIEFRVAPAEASGLGSGSVDLVTVAQALHWFDIDAFNAEACRVLRPGGVLAAWCYGTCRLDGDCERIVHDYYQYLDPWWPPERMLIERGYRDIALPGTALSCPALSMSVSWTAQQMLAYLASWSATVRCGEATGGNPLLRIAEPLQEAWGTKNRTVRWPVHLKASRL